MGAAVGGSIPFAANMPGGLIPAAMAQDKPRGAAAARSGRKGTEAVRISPARIDKLVVLGDRPLVAETPGASAR